MADRIGVINNGELVITENKKDLMQRLGRKEFIFDLNTPMNSIPDQLAQWNLLLKKLV